MNQFAGTYSG